METSGAAIRVRPGEPGRLIVELPYSPDRVARIKTIRDLVSKKPEELMAVKNFGKKSLDEIKDRLKDMGLSLGMHV